MGTHTQQVSAWLQTLMVIRRRCLQEHDEWGKASSNALRRLRHLVDYSRVLFPSYVRVYVAVVPNYEMAFYYDLERMRDRYFSGEPPTIMHYHADYIEAVTADGRAIVKKDRKTRISPARATNLPFSTERTNPSWYPAPLRSKPKIESKSRCKG